MITVLDEPLAQVTFGGLDPSDIAIGFALTAERRGGTGGDELTRVMSLGQMKWKPLPKSWASYVMRSILVQRSWGPALEIFSC